MLREYLAASTADRPTYAYGDAASDLPVLRWAEHGIMVRRGRLVETAE